MTRAAVTVARGVADPVGQGENQSGHDKRQVNAGQEIEVPIRLVVDLHIRFQQLDRGYRNDRGHQFELKLIEIDARHPLRPVLVLARINASAAGVTAKLEDNRISLTTKQASAQNIVVSDDTRGFLSAARLKDAVTQKGNTDTAATYTERFLMAFGIPFYLVENDGDSDRISIAFKEAEKIQGPVVVLVGDEYHGFNR